MPLLRGGRPLKQWRSGGVCGPEVMLCVGVGRIGLLPMHWWAVAEHGRPIAERTTLGRGGVRCEGSVAQVEAPGVRVQVELGASGAEPVETLSPTGAGKGYIWTRKQAGVRARGFVELGDRRHELEAEALVDESAGYHARHTSWMWSAGVGRAAGGERVGWNLVTGVHDAPEASERSIWVDGRPSEVGPVEFAPDLSGVSFAEGGALGVTEEWAARTDRTNLGWFRSRYRQPFATFGGALPGGLELAEGYGVMEEHDVWW
jgi:hypothetical protein